MSTKLRLGRLLSGLWLFGASVALLVRADLGLGPWDVLHQGISRHLHVSIGVVVIAVSGVVLLAWIPLRQRPGFGTLANLVLVGLSLDGTLALLPTPSAMVWRASFVAVGVVANALATALYIGAGLGAGARDGLMLGLAARGLSIRAARTGVEVSVLAVGWLLGGTVGVATIAYTLSIGPLAHLLIPLFSVTEPHEKERHAVAHHRC